MSANQLRIIAGKWRGRKIKFAADQEGLRPTPDRVRETLFNWLSPYIAGARCLDLFAGSGALGFEALSRGAEYVLMIDRSANVVSHLKQQLALLGTDQADVMCLDVPRQLSRSDRQFDIVFIDPPYQAHLCIQCAHHLEGLQILSKNALIYLEASEFIEDNELPQNWTILKRKQAGQVAYHLVQREEKNDIK